MEGLEIRSIPVKVLARIICQLPTLPTTANIDLIPLLTAGLEHYGHTSDLHAFLNYCNSTMQQQDQPWIWEQYEINKDADWDIANNKKEQELIGLRFLLNSETSRHWVELTRYSKNIAYDPQCLHFYQGRAVPIDTILKDTLSYFDHSKKEGDVNSLIHKWIGLRLEKYTKDNDAFQKQLDELDHADYHLMGVLMVKYDSSASGGYGPRSWCFYLRDYVSGNKDGSTWRVIIDDEEEQKIDSDQALADVRGIPNQCSEFSKDYRPVYLFYGNLDMLQRREQQEHTITLEDYTFEEDDDLPPEEEDNEFCMHCGIKEIINDLNDMFFCENCNRGVHQLCEDPPIQNYEKEVDPWFCRSCSRVKDLPIPPPPSSKRKRTEDHDRYQPLLRLQ